jgi:hypothetical protein
MQVSERGKASLSGVPSGAFVHHPGATGFSRQQRTEMIRVNPASAGLAFTRLCAARFDDARLSFGT